MSVGGARGPAATPGPKKGPALLACGPRSRQDERAPLRKSGGPKEVNMVRAPFLVSVLLSLAVGTAGARGGPFRYPEGKHGKGELRYVHGLPVLTVAGTPEEIGEQVGVLALRPARR